MNCFWSGYRFATVALAALALAPLAAAQMELRASDAFDPAVYQRMTPAVGAQCPELQLCDVDGRPRSLHALRGRVVVLVKGSFT